MCDLLAIEVSDQCVEHGWIRERRVVQFQTITLAKEGKGEQLGIWGLSNRLHTELAKFKPQVVFLPGWSCTAAFLAQYWCGIHSVPTVVMSESNSWDAKRLALKEWVKRRLAYMYSAALVGGTAHKRYMTMLGMPPERVFLGYDVVDNDHFAKNAEEARNRRSEVRGQYGLPENYFLASARFVEKKNLPTLIRAYARYREISAKPEVGSQKSDLRSPVFSCSSSSPWSLVLLGDGPLKSDLCRLISSLGLQHCVQLPGFKQYDELPVYYGLAGAFVHSSATEQWGLVVNEAMASGLPVLVADRCGCAIDLVEVAKNGFTFNSQDGEQIAQLMQKIAGMEPKERHELGQSGRETISNWSSQRFAQGANAAVTEALQVGARSISLFDRALLQFLAISR